MSATYGSLQTVLEPCGPVVSHNQTMQFTPPPSVNEWHGDVEMAEGETSCDVISFFNPASLTGEQLTTNAESSRYELIELHSQPAVTSNHSVTSHHQPSRRDSQLMSPAAAADTELNSGVGKQSDLDRIKKAKHNRVEKRRRSNINEQMKTLGSLLPRNASGSCKLRQNKGNILKETVAYIRLLQQDQARLVTVEQRTRQLYSANRHIIARLKELEELLSTSERSPRVTLGDCGLLIDDLDAHIKKELSSTAAVNAPFTSRTGDDMVTCAL